MNKKIFFVLIFITLVSIFLNIYKKNQSPPCFNADEAANGYNAYSILKTGRDEYGKLLPLRFKSFGDYKMPIFTYLSVPFIWLFGLSEEVTRLSNVFIALLFPWIIFFLVSELFNNKKIGIIASFLVATSLGLQIIGRQAHEGYISAFLVCGACLFFIRYVKKQSAISQVLFYLSILLMLFSYQSARVFALLFLMISIIFLIKKKIKSFWFVGILIIVMGFFLVTDIIYKPARLGNLIFYKNLGFSLKINELRGEGGKRFLYNKATIGINDLINECSKYFSPQFLAVDGDANLRFGFFGMASMTMLVYVFIFIGIFYLFKNNERWRYLIMVFFLSSAITGALSWAGTSITRSLFIVVVANIIAAYGFYNLLMDFKKVKRNLIFISLFVLQLYFLFFAWDFYFNHYPKRAVVVRSWQCGYKELASYIKNNYDKFDRFYITKKNGQPYIFLLFYLNYPPKKYQAQANLSAPDEYGFGQVERFDKFEFNFKDPQKLKKEVTVGYPDDFSGLKEINSDRVKKIKVGGEEIFWIFEQPLDK